MNIIVTGATGFIGKNLLVYLAQKPKNNFLVTLRSRKKFNSLKIKQKNLSKIKPLLVNSKTTHQELVRNLKLFKPDLLIHLATCYIHEHRSDDINDLVSSNILFGTKLLQACIEVGCQKIINTSTVWEYYEDKKIPVNLYAATKSAFDQILNYYYSAYKLQIITLHLFDTFGENDPRKKLIPYLIQNLNKNIEISLSEGRQIMEFLHIDDVVELYQHSIKKINESKKSFKVSYFPQGEQFTLRQLIKLFQKITHSSIQFKFGEKPYRFREVMKITRGKNTIRLSWQPKKNLTQLFYNLKKSSSK